MKTRWKISGVLVLCGLAACATLGSRDDDDDEKEIPLSDVPKAVLDAAKGAVPGIVLSEAEVEEEDGTQVYEVEGTAKGEEYEIEVTAAGKVLEVNKGEEDDDDEGDDDDDEGEDDDDDDDDKADAGDDNENEKEIALSEVPKVVQDAARGAVAGIVLSEAEVEEENGRKVYTVDGIANGKEYEVEVAADGKVLEVEEDD